MAALQSEQMSFARTQKGVAAGMAAGFLLCAAAFLSPQLPNVSPEAEARLKLWLACSLLNVCWLLIAVGRLALHRFFTPADIDGGGRAVNSERANYLQALVQNTLEQCIMAMIASGAWLYLGPIDRCGLAIIFTAFFAIGRLLFFIGYSRGAAARALGFALTFYPSVAMIVATMPAALTELLAP